MRKIIKLVLILLIMGYQSNLVNAQNHLYDSSEFPKARIDSMLNEAVKFVREHDLHKDNKDSAWINDFNGHYFWNSRANSKEGKTITLLDSISNNYYILDSTHTTITAFSKLKQIIWKTNPRKDNSLSEYRLKNPAITYYNIGVLNWNIGEHKKGERVISISYSNSQFGFLDLKTGNFTFAGQD